MITSVPVSFNLKALFRQSFAHSWSWARWEILDLQLSWVGTQKLESPQDRGLNVTSLSSSATMSYRQRGLQRHGSVIPYFWSQRRKLAPLLTSPYAQEAWGAPGEYGAYIWVWARSQWRTWATSSSQIWCLCQTGQTTWFQWTFWTWT